MLTSMLFLAACQKDEAAAPQTPSAPPPVEVSVVTLHPQSVAMTATLPGRTVASLVAEVRPQVSGIIRERLFNEGGEVKKGDVLYQIDPATYQAALASAVANQQRAEAAVPTAQAKAVRDKDLRARNIISQQQLEESVASLEQAKAEVAAAKANVDAADINLDYTRIVAAIDGQIDKSTLTPGALVTANQAAALTTIRNIDPIYVDITDSSTNLLNFRQAVDEGRIKIVGPGVNIKLLLDNGTIYKLDGKLGFAEANVNETTGTFSLRAEFPNPERLLLPGMYVRALIGNGILENSFLVPQRAVMHNPRGEAYVFAVGKDGKVEERTLTVHESVGNNWVVESGLNDGDRIVVEGLQRVRSGQPVTPSEVIIDAITGEVRERADGSQSGMSGMSGTGGGGAQTPASKPETSK